MRIALFVLGAWLSLGIVALGVPALILYVIFYA